MVVLDAHAVVGFVAAFVDIVPKVCLDFSGDYRHKLHRCETTTGRTADLQADISE